MTGPLPRTVVTLLVLLAFCVLPGFFGATAAALEFAPSNPAPAASDDVDSASTEKKYTGEKISLDFQNADIHNLLRIISEVAGKNIVLSSAVKGRVTLKLKDVPWDQALDIVLASQNLGVEETGNVLVVYDRASRQSVQNSPENTEESGLGGIAALPPLAKKVLTAKYVPVSLVEAKLKNLKSARGKLVVVGNDIYIEDEPGAIAAMTQTFMLTDRLSRQILIEARIVETSAALAWKLGLLELASDDYSSGDEIPVPGGDDRETSWPGASDFPGGAKLHLVVLNEAEAGQLKTAWQAPESSGEARTVAAPRIMAANDQEVLIKNAWGPPYCTGSSSAGCGAARGEGPTPVIKVKPHVEDGDQFVSLDITLTRDDRPAGGEPAFSDDNAAALTIKDGETVAIGGVFATPESGDGFSVARILPLTDWLYKNRPSSERPNSEMLIFITAKIIPINL